MREMSRRQLLTGVCGTVAGAAVAAPGAGIAMAGMTAWRTADAAAARAAERVPGSVLWRAQDGPGTQGPLLSMAAGYGVAYASNLQDSGAGLVCAFDARTGARAWQLSCEVWQVQAAGPGAVFWSTVIAGGAFGTGQQQLIASSAADGRRLWSYDSGWPNISVRYADGMLLVSAYGTLTALDARTGRRAWSQPPSSYVWDVATAGGTVYASGYDSSGLRPGPPWLVAMNIATGAQRWRLTGELTGLAAGGGVVCVSLGPGMFAVSASDGRRLWQSDADATVQAVCGGFVISQDFDSGSESIATLRAFRLSTGALAWNRTLATYAQLMASASNVLYIGGGTGKPIAALAAGTGKALWTCRLDAPAQAAAATGDVLCVIDTQARLYAVQA